MFKKRKEEKIVTLPETVKSSYEFNYKLNYSEAYETFLLLALRWSKKMRVIIGVLLTTIAVGTLVGYALDNMKTHYFLMAIVAIGLLFYLLYVPVLKAQKGAKKVHKQNGWYQMRITAGGEILLPRADALSLAGDKDARCIETDKIFIIRTDRMNTFCLPKRIMKKDEIEGVREILKAYIKYQIRE